MLKNLFMGTLGLAWTVLYVRFLASQPDQSWSEILFSGNGAPWIWMSVTNMPDYLVPYWYALVIANCVMSFTWVFVVRWYIGRKQKEINANSSSFNHNANDHHLAERMGRGGENLALDVIHDTEVIHQNIKNLRHQQAVVTPVVGKRYIGTVTPSTTMEMSPPTPIHKGHTAIVPMMSKDNNVVTQPITSSNTDMKIPVAQSFKKVIPLEIEAGGTRHIIDWKKEQQWATKLIGWSKSLAMFTSLVAAQAVVNYYAYVNAPNLQQSDILVFCDQCRVDPV